MSEFDQTGDLAAEDRPDEEEYVGEDPGAVSPDTGTSYTEEGAAETTPHDLEVLDEDEE